MPAGEACGGRQQQEGAAGPPVPAWAEHRVRHHGWQLMHRVILWRQPRQAVRQAVHCRAAVDLEGSTQRHRHSRPLTNTLTNTRTHTRPSIDGRPWQVPSGHEAAAAQAYRVHRAYENSKEWVSCSSRRGVGRAGCGCRAQGRAAAAAAVATAVVAAVATVVVGAVAAVVGVVVGTVGWRRVRIRAWLRSSVAVGLLEGGPICGAAPLVTRMRTRTRTCQVRTRAHPHGVFRRRC